MTLIRRLIALLILVSLVAGCVGPCAEEPPPPTPVDERDPAPAKTPRAPAEPPVKEAERDVLALVADLESDDPAVVLAAAKQMKWQELTAAEMERLVPLLWKAYLADLDGDVNWNELRSFVGSVEVPDLLRSLPAEMKAHEAEFIAGGLHRMMHADHLPVLAEKLTEIDDPRYREALVGSLVGIALEYTDRHREIAARATLDRTTLPDGEGPGYPGALVAVLEDWAEDPENCPSPRPWIARWMNSERPGPKDAALLLSVAAREEKHWMYDASLRALGFLSDPETLAHLKRWEEAKLVARGALARRGDEAALARIERDSVSTSSALAVLFDVAPDRAAEVVRERILAKGPAAETAVSRLADVLRESRYWYGGKITDRMFEGVREEALRSNLAGTQLAWIGAVVPGCRTGEFARRACTLLLERHPPPGFFRFDEVVAFLEIGAPELYRKLLRTLAGGKAGDLRDVARSHLLWCGDRASAGMLVDHVKAQGADLVDTVALARVGGPEVEAFLREIDVEKALAVFYGMPRSVAWYMESRDCPDPAPMREFIRAGKPVEAVLELLRQDPDAAIWGIGRLRDDRIREWIEARRAERMDVPRMTGELMLAGDPAARAETWAALLAGRYRWVDEADVEILTLDYDLGTIPHWLNDLESNCCRFNIVAQIFDELFGLDLDDVRNSPFATPAAVAREYWERYGGRFVRPGPAGDRFIPAVR